MSVDTPGKRQKNIILCYNKENKASDFSVLMTILPCLRISHVYDILKVGLLSLYVATYSSSHS